VYANIGEHRILSLAAGVTYYSILAIFPALAALVAIYGLFSDPVGIAKHLDELSGVVPSGAIDVAREQLTRLSSKSSQSLGFTFIIAFSVSLWSANAAMKSTFDTLNIIYNEQEKRDNIKLNAISLTFTIAGIAFILAALGGACGYPDCPELSLAFGCRRTWTPALADRRADTRNPSPVAVLRPLRDELVRRYPGLSRLALIETYRFLPALFAFATTSRFSRDPHPLS
jgi:hypothetical protein